MPTIKDFTPRLYQETILNTAIKANTLICLPTGRGKTKTALLIAIHRLNNFPNSKILFLTPTKPLASQIAEEFKENSSIQNVCVFTGETKPEERAELFQTANVIVSTPQGLSNDIINKRVDLKAISCLFVDECQHATGDYDYVWIAKQYQKTSAYPRIVALSASPGSSVDTIQDVCKNLFIEDIEVRTDEDLDVKPYVHETTVEHILVDLPEEFKAVQKYLDACIEERLRVLKELGVVSNVTQTSKTQLLGAQKALQRRLAQGERVPEVWQALSLIAGTMKIYHAQELFETQSLHATYEYLQKLYTEAETTKVKATKNLVVDSNFKAAYYLIQTLFEKNIEHPKLLLLRDIITREIKHNEKILIFNHYRDSAARLKEMLDEIEGVRCALFIGQAKKKGLGLSQKQQIQLLEDFRNGTYNVLIGTSVGEEGIDIPAVDLIIFYEPVSSAIRTVQRRGRTGRMEEGRVIVLVTKGTQDETSRWAAYHKEKKMHTILKDLKTKLHLGRKTEPTLADFQKKLKIYADSREKGSGIIKYLVDHGVDVHMQNLDVGDFLVSERVGVERKEVNDFVSSLIDKRLMQQVHALKDSFPCPLLIIEGTDDIFSVRNMHPNALRGALAWIAVDMKVPILSTKDSRETAEMLMTLARREQEESTKDFGIRGEKKPMTDTELQEYIVAGLPGVGPQLAKNLLKEFGSIKNIVSASEEELQDVENIGKKKALEIRKILDEEYKEEK